MKRFLFSLLFVILLAGSFVVIFEVATRALLSKQLEILYDERNLAYRYDELLGWFPRENSQGFYEGSVRISYSHNSRGFRDSEPLRTDRPAIAFLGESYVWGYDVEAEDRFTDRLKPLFPSWEILNFGVSGYGTAQELLLLKQRFKEFSPQAVFLVYQEHDNLDNMSNQFYGYYRPFFVMDGQLLLKGVPVPKSVRYAHAEYRRLFSISYTARAFARLYAEIGQPPMVEVLDPTHALLKDLRDFTSANGSQLLLGLESNDSGVRAFCSEYAIPCLDLGNPLRFEGHGRHWTKEGHGWVAARVHEFLEGQLKRPQSATASHGSRSGLRGANGSAKMDVGH